MRIKEGIELEDVRAVYSGAEGRLWELIMGEQVHIGGFASSMDLANKADIRPRTRGVDLCCCTGAGMRFLLRFRDVAHMTGVDATEAMVRLGRARCEEAGLAENVDFVLADVCDSGLPEASMDFAWGEDAWCYVVDKPKLFAEAARIVKPGGKIAFTDWIEGDAGLATSEADRFLTFMKFPNLLTIDEYRALLDGQAWDLEIAEDTGRFAPHARLYLDMLNMQLSYDALNILGFDMNLLKWMGEEMQFVCDLATAGKIAQGLFVAKRN